MITLQEEIISKIKVIDHDRIQASQFLNHQVDTKIIFEIGKEFAQYFQCATKILTIESSGIPVALACAYYLNKIPCIYAKKGQYNTSIGENYHASVYSFTKETTQEISVLKSFIHPNDQILIIDDFLAHGHALKGLIDIIHQSGATLVGAGFVIEKEFQGGRKLFSDAPFPIYSLLRIKDIKDQQIIL